MRRPALTEAAPPDSGAGPQDELHGELAPRVAVCITAVVIGGFFFIGLTYLLRARPSGVGLAVCGVLMLALLALQMFHSFPFAAPRLVPHRRKTLAAQALITYVPFPIFEEAWLGVPGFLAGSTLLVLRSATGWAGFATVIGTVGLLNYTVGYGTAELAYNMVATGLTGLVVYGLSRLTDLVRQVQAARAELARLAIVQERLRFARDLHDLLGYSLSTITLKCELTHRLVRIHPERAETEITEILRTARQALADVRSVASSYLNMSLSREVSAAESLLCAVGIQTEVRMEVDLPAGPVDTVLATVLREGITNMLRHSKAQHCMIAAEKGKGRVRVAVANDGVGAETATLSTGGVGTGGSGLHNLTARVAALGGALTAGSRDDGWFELTAEVPA